MVTDAAGNFYLAIASNGSADSFGGANRSDIYLAKYGLPAESCFKAAVGGLGKDEARQLAVDGAGNVYVAGLFGGNYVNPNYLNPNASFTMAVRPASCRGRAGSEISAFLAKFDANGNLQWVRGSPGRGNHFSIAASTTAGSISPA